MTPPTEPWERAPLRKAVSPFNGCNEGLAWAEGFEGAWQTALLSCPDRSWLVWLYTRLVRRGYLTTEPLIQAVALCVRAVLPAEVDARAWRLLEQVEAYCRGEKGSWTRVRELRNDVCLGDTWEGYMVHCVAWMVVSAHPSETGWWAGVAIRRIEDRQGDALPILRRELGPHLLRALEDCGRNQYVRGPHHV